MGHYKALDGVRGLSTLWVTAVHIPLMYALFMPTNQDVHNVVGFMGSFTNMDTVGVELLFFLTGFLLTSQLITRTKSDKEPVLPEFPGFVSSKEFYIRRFLLRIYPSLLLLPLFVPMIGTYRAGASNPNGFILTKLFNPNATTDTEMKQPGLEWIPVYLSNFQNLVPTGGPYSWLWTLAVQGQFYLLLPVLVKRMKTRRNLLWASGIICLIGMVSRIGVSLLIRPHPVMVMIFGSLEGITMERFWTFFVGSIYFYNFTLFRMNTIFLGVILAILQKDHQNWLLSWFGRTKDSKGTIPIFGRLIEIGCICLVFLCRYAVSYRQLLAFASFSPFYQFIFMTCFENGGLLESISIFGFFVMLINRIGLFGQICDTFFSYAFWKPVAKISYQLYLINPLVLQALALHCYSAYLDTNSKLLLSFWFVTGFLLSLGAAFLFYHLATGFEGLIRKYLFRAERPNSN